MGKTSYYLAKAISIIFHPLLMPTLGLLAILFSGSYLSMMPTQAKTILIIVTAIGTFILPISMVPLYSFFNIIKNVEMEPRENRLFPYLITTIFYFSTYFFLRKFPIPFINSFILASAICILANAIINYWWKISSHTTGIGGIIGLLITLTLRLNAEVVTFFIIAIIIAGLIGFARLRLEAHTPKQVYAGYLLGFIVVAGITYFL